MPRYREVGGLRLAHIDEGDGPPVLMLHGQPTWSFLFRGLIAAVRDAGFRCVVPDYAGFGRSDKPTDLEWYSYDRHTELCASLIEDLDLRDITLVAHDWGGPIGLRMATDHPERFARYVLLDAPFFTGRQRMPEVWLMAHEFIERTPDIPVGTLVRAGCKQELPAAVVAAYDAPFPDMASKAGARAFPLRVLPRSPDLPAAKACWRVLKSMRNDTRPTLILWGESDTLLPLELAHWVAGALKRDPPQLIEGAGHFLLEDRGEEVAGLIVDWLTA